jgi:2-(1,2-epoxy-1,2-dihydrophenyl)acetyl-CoA isomerase
MSDAPGYEWTRSHGVATLVFDRQEAGNALLPDAVPRLADDFRALGSDGDCRVVLIRGAGKNFCAGGDVRGFARSLDQPVEERRRDFGRRLANASGLVEAYLSIAAPVVVAVQGAVAGAGLLYPLGADLVIADESAVFLFSHLRVGLPPDAGVSMLLPRAVGMRRARELVLTAAKVAAEEACACGLASRVVASADLQTVAADQAARIASLPAGALRAAKRLLSGGFSSDREHLEGEAAAIVAAVGSGEFEEGVRAFLEKRAPNFRLDS